MPADSYDPILGIILQGAGNNNNAWGDTFNNSGAKIIARAIAGLATHAVTGGTLDYSGSPPPAAARQDVDLIHDFTGVLVSDQIWIVPNLSKTWVIRNSTTGAFGLFVKTTSGTATQIPQGCTKFVMGDGANVLKRLDDEEIGSIQISGKAAAGPGELLCNGASLLRASFPDLFGKISTTWGSADGTHFTLPDCYTAGRFLRSSTASVATGTYQADQIGAHTHAITGVPAVGTLTTDNPGNHTHVNTLTDLGHTHNYTSCSTSGNTGGGGAFGNSPTGATSGGNNSTPMSITNAANGAHTHNVTGTLTAGTLATASTGGTETRPLAAVMTMCIRY